MEQELGPAQRPGVSSLYHPWMKLPAPGDILRSLPFLPNNCTASPSFLGSMVDRVVTVLRIEFNANMRCPVLIHGRIEDGSYYTFAPDWLVPFDTEVPVSSRLEFIV